jgi:hypothetical protein
VVEGVTMEFQHMYVHPPDWARYGMLALIVFPFVSFPLLKWKPRIHLAYFFIPLIAGAILLSYGLYDARMSMAVGRPPSQIMMSAAIAEGIMFLFFGAGSTFGTALLQIRSRRRGLGWVMAVGVLVMIACWATMNHYIRIARTGV